MIYVLSLTDVLASTTIPVRISLYMQLKLIMNHRTTAYSELEGTQQGSSIQLLREWPTQGWNPNPSCYEHQALKKMRVKTLENGTITAD